MEVVEDDDENIRVAAAEALGKLGVEVEPARLEPIFSQDRWPRAGEFTIHPIGIINRGSGPAVDLHLLLSGPAVGNKITLNFEELSPGATVSSSISMRPEAPGSAVPLH